MACCSTVPAVSSAVKRKASATTARTTDVRFMEENHNIAVRDRGAVHPAPARLVPKQATGARRVPESTSMKALMLAALLWSGDAFAMDVGPPPFLFSWGSAGSAAGQFQ